MKTLRTLIRALALTAFFFLALGYSAPAALAQSPTPEFRVDPRRNFGYGNGSDVRGSFTNSLYGPTETVDSVIFLIDGAEMATVSEPPFKVDYNTNQFASGRHQMSAIVTTLDGRQVTTPVVSLNFLSAEQESESMRTTVLPFLGVVLAAMLIGVGAQFLTARRDSTRAPGAPRNYGLMGGAICPRCGRPFPIHLFSLNLAVGRFDRCDNCGKFSFVRRAHPDLLAAAELAERAALRESEHSLPGAGAEESEEERLKKMLDESKYSE